ncbi:MAG: arginine--tRNA ligase, partial [Kiritimatiellae bacterium]|nr:arginine--tRNA ligase [Kiritimatiellia bacterium]
MMSEPGTLEQQLTAWMEQVLCALYPEADFSDINTQVVPTADDRFGDYQCNAAMALAGRMRKPPREIAQQVLSQPLPDCLERVEVAGPGFINMRLRTDWLASALAETEKESVPLVPDVGAGKTVVIDYSSPNVAKPMHIGHIRSTVIGNALDRIYRCLGYHVIADNHVGDWGTQFGLMILGYKHFVQPEALERDPIEELERIYRESYNKSKEEDAWLNAARTEL